MTLSALDKIDEMYGMIKDLQDQVSLLHKLMGVFQNQFLSTNPTVVLPAQMPTKPPAILQDRPITVVAKTANPSNALVRGKFFTANNTPVGGAMVKITDADQRTVKQLTTSNDGSWETHLPVGNYRIKHMKQGLAPMYKMVEVKEGQANVEVV